MLGTAVVVIDSVVVVNGEAVVVTGEAVVVTGEAVVVCGAAVVVCGGLDLIFKRNILHQRLKNRIPEESRKKRYFFSAPAIKAVP